MKVKELLANGNWCQGSYGDGRGNYCLVGAINKCYPQARQSIIDLVCTEIVKDDLSQQLAIAAGVRNIDTILIWNDDFDRTHSDVLALVERLDI